MRMNPVASWCCGMVQVQGHLSAMGINGAETHFREEN
jgi:hypothetical protein